MNMVLWMYLGRKKSSLLNSGISGKELMPYYCLGLWIPSQIVYLGGRGGYASTTKGVWQDLKERFDKLDGSRAFTIHQEIATMSQGVQSISVYFTKLKDLWDEFESMIPSPACSCEKSKDFVLYGRGRNSINFLWD